MADEKEGGANRPLTEFEQSVINLNDEVGVLVERVRGIASRQEWLFRLLLGILLLIAGLYLKGS